MNWDSQNLPLNLKFSNLQTSFKGLKQKKKKKKIHLKMGK